MSKAFAFQRRRCVVSFLFCSLQSWLCGNMMNKSHQKIFTKYPSICDKRIIYAKSHYLLPNPFLMKKLFRLYLPLVIFINSNILVFSQDTRTQYPGFLKNAYFNFNFGYINFPFSSEQLETGYNAESVYQKSCGPG